MPRTHNRTIGKLFGIATIAVAWLFASLMAWLLYGAFFLID